MDLLRFLEGWKYGPSRIGKIQTFFLENETYESASLEDLMANFPRSSSYVNSPFSSSLYSGGKYPIHACIENNNLEFVQLLVKYGGLVTVGDYNGDTPLHYAIKLKYKEIEDFLVSQGANEYLKNELSVSPKELREQMRQDEIDSKHTAELKSLNFNKGNFVKEGEVTRFKVIVNEMSNQALKSWNYGGMSLLHHLVSSNVSLEWVQILCLKENLKLTSNTAPLHVALKTYQWDVAKYLIFEHFHNPMNFNFKNYFHQKDFQEFLSSYKMVFEETEDVIHQTKESKQEDLLNLISLFNSLVVKSIDDLKL